MTDFESTESIDTAEGGWDGYAEDAGPVEETGPPDVSEALSQMQATIEARLPAPEDEEEYDDGPDYGAQMPELDDDELMELAEQSDWLGEDANELDPEELNELIEEKVEQAVLPLAADYEFDRRVEAIHDLAERYPELRDPQAIGEIEAEVEEIGRVYGINAANTDPALVELVVQARGARAAANSELETPDAEAGAVLETGVGPSKSQPEVDPQTKAYLDAIAGVPSNNVFSS